MTTGSDKPDAEATARARAWIESEKHKLLHPADPLEGMTIHVQPPPNAKLIRGRRIDILNIFFHEEFEVTVSTTSQRVRFNLNLPEWLPALTAFLRTAPPVSTNELTRLGDSLTIERSGDTFRIDRYDLDARDRVHLALTMPQLRALHGRLVAELIVAAHRAADGFVELDGLELLDAGVSS